MNAIIVLLLLLTVLICGAGLWARYDFRRWVALGPGGLPPTARGWVVTTRLRMRKRDPIDPAMFDLSDAHLDGTIFLDNLPKRGGPRPKIAPWPIPHRQTNQFASTLYQRRTAALFDNAVSAQAALVEYRLSFYEKHTPAISLRLPECGHAHALLGQGEVAHVHPSDGSMHMIFSVADARRIIECGWGERHPLAGVRPRLPITYLYIYPPRDDFELGIIGDLLSASVGHMANLPAMSKPRFSCT